MRRRTMSEEHLGTHFDDFLAKVGLLKATEVVAT